MAFAEVHTSKMPTTAADLLYDRLLPFYERPNVPVKLVLRQRARIQWSAGAVSWGLLLASHDIEHRTSKVRAPRSNGFIECLNRTLLDEHFRTKSRQKWYESTEKVQDLDIFLE